MRFAKNPVSFLLAALQLASIAAAADHLPPQVRDHRRGIPGRIEIGERVYNTERDAFARVIGIEYRGTFVIRFESGYLSGQTGGGWSAADLAQLEGCSPTRRLCVGDQAYNSERGALVTIVGIESNGRLVVKFESGYLAGQVGSNWSEQDLAVTAGTGHHVPGIPTHPPVVVPHPGVPLGAGAVCTTQSNGRHFRVTAPSFGEARTQVIARCQRDPYTDRSECQRLSSCQ